MADESEQSKPELPNVDQILKDLQKSAGVRLRMSPKVQARLAANNASISRGTGDETIASDAPPHSYCPVQDICVLCDAGDYCSTCDAMDWCVWNDTH